MLFQWSVGRPLALKTEVVLCLLELSDSSCNCSWVFATAHSPSPSQSLCCSNSLYMYTLYHCQHRLAEKRIVVKVVTHCTVQGYISSQSDSKMGFNDRGTAPVAPGVPTLPTHTHLPWQRINIGERCVNSINHFLELIAKEVKTLLGAVCSERMHLDDQVQCRQLSMYGMTGTQLSVHVFQTTNLLYSRPPPIFLGKVLCRVCQVFPIYMYMFCTI